MKRVTAPAGPATKHINPVVSTALDNVRAELGVDMAQHREQVDKRMMREINRKVITPLLLDLGARYLVKPYMGKYDDEEKTATVGLRT